MSDFEISGGQEEDGYREGDWYFRIYGTLTSHRDSPEGESLHRLGMGVYGASREAALKNLAQAALNKAEFYRNMAQHIYDSENITNPGEDPRGRRVFFKGPIQTRQVKLIKALRFHTGLDLKSAKALVDQAKIKTIDLGWMPPRTAKELYDHLVNDQLCMEVEIQ